MNAELKNGKLIITLDAKTKNIPTSKSGKSKVVASTNGNHAMHGLLVDGKPLVIGVNAYIPA